MINPQEIDNITTALEVNILKSKLSTDKTIILTNRIETVKSKLNTLIPHRHRRGLFNFVGTIHKWIYGTMDNDDRQEIEDHLKTIDTNNHNIILNSNQQVKINTIFNETFTKIKEAIAKDRENINKET